MNLVDAGGWLAYVTDGPDAGYFAPAIEKTTDLVVPTVVLQEVFRHLVRHAGEGPALEIAAAMRQARIVDLDATLALEAARLASLHNLDPIPAVIMATAAMTEAQVWTTDRRLAYLPEVRYRESRTGG